MDKEAIIAAIDHFNEQLEALPEDIDCAIVGLYPEFDDPETSPQVFLTLVDDEITWSLSVLRMGKNEAVEKLLELLQKLASALRRAGAEPMA